MTTPPQTPSRTAETRALRVLLIGQARWTRELGEGLSAHTDVDVDTMPIDSAADTLQMLSPARFRRADVLVRVGFRPGAHTTRGAAFDAVFNLMRASSGTPVVYYWLGTDAANAVSDAAEGKDSRRFRSMAAQATHLADSESVRAELETLGITATTAWLPAPNAPQEGDVVGLPSRFTVLSYVPDARAEFYDGPTLAEVARRLPYARFLVVGGVGSWLASKTSNIEFLGWRSDIGALYDQSSVLVRMLEHDSVSCMVVEALAHGRPVVYSSEFPHALHVDFRDADGLEAELRELAAGSAGGTMLDAATVRWARDLAEPSACYGTIANELHEAAGR